MAWGMPFFFFTVVKYMQHKIYHFSHFQVYGSVALSTFTLLCSRHCCLSAELLHFSYLNPCLYWTLTPQPLETTTLLSVWESDCPRGLVWALVRLWLAYFTEHYILRVHPCCSRCQDFLPVEGGVILHCVSRPHCVCPSSVDGLVGGFHQWWSHFLQTSLRLSYTVESRCRFSSYEVWSGWGHHLCLGAFLWPRPRAPTLGQWLLAEWCGAPQVPPWLLTSILTMHVCWSFIIKRRC